MIYLFLKQYSTINKRFTRIIASVFLSALIAIVSTQAVIEFTNAKKANLAAVSLQDDLAYLSIIENTSLIPTVKLENIKSCVNATPGGSKFFAMDVCLSQLENRDANTPLIYTNNLFSVWFKAISRHPLEYVKYRLYAFDIQIRSPGSKARYYWNDGGIVPNEFGFKPANNSFTNLTYNYVQGTEKHFDFLLKPYFNLWIALLLLPILFKRRKDKRDQVLLYFLLSGISFSSAYFFVAGSDYRYSYWMSCITLFILAISLIEKKINIKFFNLDEKMLYVIWIVAVTLFLWNYGNLFTIDFAKLTN